MIARRLRQPGNAAGTFALLGLMCLLVLPARGATANSPQDQGESSSKRPSTPLPTDASSKPDPEAQSRLAAEKDIEIGDFYMHKGDIDAAIGRYQDAAGAAPHLAKPRMLLAEAFEKKKDNATAVKYYKEYLQVYPTAPDKQKILKKIEKLSP